MACRFILLEPDPASSGFIYDGALEGKVCQHSAYNAQNWPQHVPLSVFSPSANHTVTRGLWRGYYSVCRRFLFPKLPIKHLVYSQIQLNKINFVIIFQTKPNNGNANKQQFHLTSLWIYCQLINDLKVKTY